MDLTGKIALVTGAGQGVGRATALLFAQAGASVVVNDFHIDRAKAVADEIEAFGGVAMARQADITNLASVEAMTSEAIARFGRIDILVNNAGTAGPSDPNISPKDRKSVVVGKRVYVRVDPGGRRINKKKK